MTRQVFVTGGVVSSLGKGITTASLARLLGGRGLTVAVQKLDPYLNIDPGTLNPAEHGETYVTADGLEVDLDAGHYWRYGGVDIGRDGSVTAGSVYQAVLAAERRGEYLGRTVQVIPHVTDEICRRVLALHRDDVDVVLTEIGGTVGDIESLPFLEAARQLHFELGHENVALVHVTLVPVVSNGEQKTKPTQHSVAELRTRGLSPDIIVARCPTALEAGVRAKLAQMCGVSVERVIDALDEANLYRIPLALHDAGLDQALVTRLGLEGHDPSLDEWERIVLRYELSEPAVRVAVVGKYGVPDAYLSVTEALRHAAGAAGVHAEVVYVDAEELSGENRGETVPLEELDAHLGTFDALVVPGGFGERGFEGKVAALHWARERRRPVLGLCLGMQAMVVEAARSLARLPDAHSRELDAETAHAVVELGGNQDGVTELGATMRLGDWEASVVPGTVAHRVYGTDRVVERHRHRYEMNATYTGVLAAVGLQVSAHSVDGGTCEMVEVADHPFYVATQAHPEFTSRPERPHPLFCGLIDAAIVHHTSDHHERDR